MIVLPLKILDIRSVEPVVMISRKTASKLKLRHTQILTIRNEINTKLFVATPVVTEGMIEDDVVGISQRDANWLSANSGDQVTVLIRRDPESIEFVKRKIKGEMWTRNQIYSITNDISKRLYTSLEIASYTLSSYFRGYSREETANFARAMAECGTQFNFQERAYDKHSIGGIPGNKVSLLIVPIVAASGLLIPKTSSRAITSPSGTADTMEVLADVSFTPDEVSDLAPKSRGMIVWNAPLKLSPMDDIVIGVKKFIKIDPEQQMMASIISTKIAMGIDGMVIDVPTGLGSKIQEQPKAIDFAHTFVGLCRDVGIDAEGILTVGSKPLGSNIGPALEAKEALSILEGNVKNEVLTKSLALAGIILEMGGRAEVGKGYQIAQELVSSGKALAKMHEIIEIQGGDPKITSNTVPLGEYTQVTTSTKEGYVSSISNENVKKICSALGNPSSKLAGLSLHVRIGEYVKQGDALFTLYSDSESKLSSALQIAVNNPPILVEGIVLRRVKVEN